MSESNYDKLLAAAKSNKLRGAIEKVKAGKPISSAEEKLIEKLKHDASQMELLATATQMATMIGVTIGRVTQLKSDGVFISNGKNQYDVIASVKNYVEKIKDKKKETVAFADGVPDIEESKARKVAAEAGLAELKLQEAKMEVVSIAEVDERDSKIGACVRAAMTKLRSELPPRLEGMDASRMVGTIDEYIHNLLEDMADGQSEFWEKRERLESASESDPSNE